VYICYTSEHGRIIRENTHQTDVRAAELMLAQARTDVAMKRRFTSLSFESVKFINLFNEWWSNHGSRTRSEFEYRPPRILTRFKAMKAREINPDAVRSFLADLRAEGLAASSINQCRTILCSVFNYAIRFEKYDRNPVSVDVTGRGPKRGFRAYRSIFNSFRESQEAVSGAATVRATVLDNRFMPVLAYNGCSAGRAGTTA
jgi:hypothetical protein